MAIPIAAIPALLPVVQGIVERGVSLIGQIKSQIETLNDGGAANQAEIARLERRLNELTTQLAEIEALRSQTHDAVAAPEAEIIRRLREDLGLPPAA